MGWLLHSTNRSETKVVLQVVWDCLGITAITLTPKSTAADEADAASLGYQWLVRWIRQDLIIARINK